MLRFLAPDNSSTLASHTTLPGAYLIGPDSVPIAGEVVVEDGLVRCEKGIREAAAVALQIDLDAPRLASLGLDGPVVDDIQLAPLGVLTLQTCLLPNRDKPYILALELARHRIMLFLTKLEDWQAFDLEPESSVMRLFEHARATFTRALVLAADGESVQEAMRLGYLALWTAIEASERLCLVQAQRDFGERIDGKAYLQISEEAGISKRARPVLHPTRGGVVLPTRPAVGASISPSVMSEQTQSAAIKSCDFINMPMRWIEMEPLEGEYAYTPTDRWIEWAIRSANLPVVAGPVIDFRPHCVPEWLYIWENDYDTLRELVYEHLKAIVTRYRRTVSRWTVCSGLHCGEHFKLDFQQMIDLTRICVLVVRKLHPRAKVQVEITEPWGGYHTRDRRSLPPMLYAEMLTQSGVPIDSFALRLQMGAYQSGTTTRDLMAFSSLLDQYATLDRPLSLSAIGAPATTPTPDDDTELHAQPGHWRENWTEQTQARWLSAFMSVAASKPYVESVCWHELADPRGPCEMRTGGLIDAQARPRESLARLSEIREAIDNARVPGRIENFDVLRAADSQGVGAEL